MIKTSRPFLGDDFLLETDAAVHLYEQFAAPAAILDYHCHLSPKDIAENRKFQNLTEIWLEGDHYKWRAMRTNGAAEQYCTGNVPPYEKFLEWAKTVPYTMRNPLYHWTHLELKNYFGIRKVLDETTAKEIYDECSSALQQDEYSVQSLLHRMNVEVVCTTDDPIDALNYHQQLSKQKSGIRMFPTFRPDKAFAVEDSRAYNEYVDKLGTAANVSIQTFEDLIAALKNRIDFFDSLGCRASDHGLEFMYFDEDAHSNGAALFKKIRTGSKLNLNERVQFKCMVLTELCKLYHSKGWVQQFHLGALRGNNSRLLRELGPDTGFDSIGDYPQAQNMSRFFNGLDDTDQLTKTIIYNINPADNEVFATMLGNFSVGTPGKMQWGSGWWFLDQKDGMERQMNTLSNMGLLSRFVGMVTDSRSFMSYPRHEYFRRILCNLLGRDIEHGELPDDFARIGKLVQDVCYTNAKQYFKL
ncbi:MAG: glucuronate isomerase [Chitinophagaceae bacterium]|nr:glucuronate isomerase [Chitinophagaceae bacterium]